MYKILIDKAFNIIEPHKKFNTQWGTIYNGDLEICPKDVIDIRMPRRYNNNRLIEPPIIGLEFEKDILDPHIIIGGENIQL